MLRPWRNSTETVSGRRPVQISTRAYSSTHTSGQALRRGRGPGADAQQAVPSSPAVARPSMASGVSSVPEVVLPSPGCGRSGLVALRLPDVQGWWSRICARSALCTRQMREDRLAFLPAEQAVRACHGVDVESIPTSKKQCPRIIYNST